LAAHTEVFPPGNLWSDEPNLESDLHRDQVLYYLIKWSWRERNDFYATGNLTVYLLIKRNQEDFRSDFFVSSSEPRRRRYAEVGQSGKRTAEYPNVTSNSRFQTLPLRWIGVKKPFIKTQRPDISGSIPIRAWFGFHLVDVTQTVDTHASKAG
jgi:hypothetical protein